MTWIIKDGFIFCRPGIFWTPLSSKKIKNAFSVSTRRHEKTMVILKMKLFDRNIFKHSQIKSEIVVALYFVVRGLFVCLFV